MREILLLFIVISIVIVGLIRPQIAVLGYVWFALMRPEALAWSDKPLSFVLAITVVASSSRYFLKVPSLLSNRVILGLFAFNAFVLMSVFAAVNPELAYEEYNIFIRIIMIALLIPLVIDSEVWLRWLVWVIAVSLGLIGCKFALFSLLHGSVRYQWGHAGFMGDNNGLALGLAMVIPVIWYSRQLLPSAILRWAFVGLAFGSMVTLVMTNSRGASVAAAVVCLAIVVQSKRRSTSLVLLSVLVVSVLLLAGQQYFDRMSTLGNSELTGSMQSRVEYLRAAFRMWTDYPLLGVGWGERNYVALAPRYLGYEDIHVVHNTYVQVLVDSGIFAFLAYIGLLWGTIVWLTFSAARMRSTKPEWEVYPRMMQVGLIAFAVGSTFYSRGNFEFAYFLIAAAAVWYQVSRDVVPVQSPASVVVEAPVVVEPPVQSISSQLVAAPPISQRQRAAKPIRSRANAAPPLSRQTKR